MTEQTVKCPCCNLPTLGERGSYEICPICWWEDDGQDDIDADAIKGGPNARYSLSDARANYKSHGHMYEDGKGIDVVEKPSKTRRNLMDYLKNISAGIENFNLEKFNKLLSDYYSIEND